MAEGMKEKLYQAYQQKGAEQSDLETKVQMAHAEGHTQGEQQGFHQGKTEGLKQVTHVDLLESINVTESWSSLCPEYIAANITFPV